MESILRRKDKAFEDKKLGTFNNSQMDVEYFHIDMTGKVRNLILNHSLWQVNLEIFNSKSSLRGYQSYLQLFFFSELISDVFFVSPWFHEYRNYGYVRLKNLGHKRFIGWRH